MNRVSTQYLREDGFGPSHLSSKATSLATQLSLLPCWAPPSTQHEQSSFPSVLHIGLPFAPNPPVVSQGTWNKIQIGLEGSRQSDSCPFHLFLCPSPSLCSSTRSGPSNVPASFHFLGHLLGFLLSGMPFPTSLHGCLLLVV